MRLSIHGEMWDSEVVRGRGRGFQFLLLPLTNLIKVGKLENFFSPEFSHR